MYPLFDLPSKLLRFFGCWPDDLEWSVARKLFVGFTFTNHICAMAFELKYVGEQFENPLEAFDAVNPTITKFITFFKLCTMIYYRKEFKYNHDKIRSYFDKDYKGVHFDIAFKARRSAYRYCLFIFLGGFFTNFCFFLRPMVNNFFQYLTGGNTTREIPFKASLPFDLNTNPTYQITYGLFSYSGLLTCVGFGAVDGIIIGYCKYLSAQFEIISNQLRTNFNAKIDDSCLPATKDEMDDFSKQLRPVVSHHVELIIRIKELSRIIAPIILVHFVSSALEIGLSLIDFIKSEGFGTVLYLIYALVVLLQLLMYCIAGTCIADAGYDSYLDKAVVEFPDFKEPATIRDAIGTFENFLDMYSVTIGTCVLLLQPRLYNVTSTKDIHESVYFTNWYRLSPKIRRDLLMLMVISTRDMSLRVPFFTPSLPAYRAILSAALSYLTILQSFF